MHVTIRQCAGKRGLMGGPAPLVRDGLAPRKRAPGLKGCCAVASEDRHVVSVTIFGDRQTAVRADDRAREWIVSNFRDLLPEPPEVLAGDAPLHEVSKPRSGGPAMFATRSRLGGRRAGGEVLPWMRERVFLT